MAKVSFLENRWDMEALVLGSLGFSTEYIQARTGLTMCQIGYRLHKAAVRRADYRNGVSPTANLVVGAVKAKIASAIRARISGGMKPRKARAS
jgi:hypothetical protein